MTISGTSTKSGLSMGHLLALCLSMLGVLPVNVFGQGVGFTASDNVAYGIIGNRFAVFGAVTSSGGKGYLYFDLPPRGGNESISNNNSSSSQPHFMTLPVAYSASEELFPFKSSPPIPTSPRKFAGTMVNNHLVVLGGNNNLYTFNDHGAWKRYSPSTTNFMFSSDARLLPINATSFYVLSTPTAQPGFYVTLTDEPAKEGAALFQSALVTLETSGLTNPQFGYETGTHHLVVVGGDGSGRLSLAFYDINLKKVERKVDNNNAPSKRTGYCFTWDPIKSSFYLFGGFNGSALLNDAYSLMYIAQEGLWRWERLSIPSDFPARANTMCVVRDSRLIVWAGDGNTVGIDAQLVTLSSPPPTSGGGSGGGGQGGHNPGPKEGTGGGNGGNVDAGGDSGQRGGSSSASEGIIIGGVVGGLALFVLVVSGALWRHRRDPTLDHYEMDDGRNQAVVNRERQG